MLPLGNHAFDDNVDVLQVRPEESRGSEWQ